MTYSKLQVDQVRQISHELFKYFTLLSKSKLTHGECHVLRRNYVYNSKFVRLLSSLSYGLTACIGYDTLLKCNIGHP